MYYMTMVLIYIYIPRTRYLVINSTIDCRKPVPSLVPATKKKKKVKKEPHNPKTDQMQHSTFFLPDHFFPTTIFLKNIFPKNIFLKNLKNMYYPPRIFSWLIILRPDLAHHLRFFSFVEVTRKNRLSTQFILLSRPANL